MVSKAKDARKALPTDAVNNLSANDINRRSYTSPNDIEIDLEQPSRKRSVDGTSERGELMSASFFDEEDADNEMGRRKWEDFMAMQQHEK